MSSSSESEYSEISDSHSTSLQEDLDWANSIIESVCDRHAVKNLPVLVSSKSKSGKGTELLQKLPVATPALSPQSTPVATGAPSIPPSPLVKSQKHTPKQKRPYVKRKVGYWKSLSQPLPSVEELGSPIFSPLRSPIRSPHRPILVRDSPEFPVPWTPRKRREFLPPTIDEGESSQAAGRGRGGRSIQRPLWNLPSGFFKQMGPPDSIPVKHEVGVPDKVSEKVSILPHLHSKQMDSVSMQHVSEFVPVAEETEKRFKQNLKQEARNKGGLSESVDHRPLTRSLSSIQKVYVSIDNFSDLQGVQLHHPKAQYVMGELIADYICPVLEMRMVKVKLKGFQGPHEFMYSQVTVFPPESLSRKVEYTSGCVCCLPDGETELPSQTETSDSEFNSDSDPIPPTTMEKEIEEDRVWEAAVPDEIEALENAEEYFRYKQSLPFDQKFHDIHWLRNHTDSFGSERLWLGKEEVGIPNISRTASPGEILNHFISPDTWARIVKQTNLYAKYKQRKDWTRLTVLELKCWLGICVFMGIQKLPRLSMHWKKDHPLFRNDFISSLMARDRWLDIMACIHLVDNRTLPKHKTCDSYDKIGKVRWLIDELCGRFRAVKPVDRYLSVDEMMVKCLSRFCPVKQYNKSKPDPHGIKVWALASASSKYVYALDVYCGSQSGPGQAAAPRPPPNQPFEDRNTYKVVMALAAFIPTALGHVLTMDNYFTSVKLFMDLLDRGVYATGTARPGIIGWPSSMAWGRKGKGQRGDLAWRMHASLQLGACVWHDNKPVGILSSFEPPWKENTVVERRQGAAKVVLPTSPSLLSYVKLMRGVDVADQLRAGYSISRKGRRWWKRLLFFILDTAFCNSWVLGQQLWEGTSKVNHPFSNHLSFNIQLGDDLVRPWMKANGIVAHPGSGILEGGVAHGPVWNSSKRRKCKECQQRTRWCCEVCLGQPHLCIARKKRCYQLYHQKQMYRLLKPGQEAESSRRSIEDVLADSTNKGEELQEETGGSAAHAVPEAKNSPAATAEDDEEEG